MKSVADGLLQAAIERGKVREHEVGCSASKLDLTTYAIEIAYERGLTGPECFDVAEVIQDIWEDS